MASGLPVLVSRRCGCAKDLMRDGVNGFTFDPYEVADIAEKMLRLSTASIPLATFGQASREIIAHWSPARFASGLSQAIEVALSNPLPRATWLDRLLIWSLLHR
jgi:glycosyltransferase involved in cell wall biosynthesis